MKSKCAARILPACRVVTQVGVLNTGSGSHRGPRKSHCLEQRRAQEDILYLRDGPEEQPRGVGKASKALVNINAPHIPWNVQLPPDHPMHRPRTGVTRGPHLCPAAFLCVLSVTHAA